jgi:glycerophosphoryl diester phosphodiesterase
MHRGAGNEPGFHQNTLEAVIYGSTVLDGAEFDIQLSKDDTLWLGHDNEVLDCAGAVVGCFQDLTDAQVQAVASCPDGTHYDRLDTVLQYVSVNFPTKGYSFDVKGQYCGLRDIPELMRAMASETDRLVRAYAAGLAVETESDAREFLAQIRDLKTPVASLVVSLGDIDGPLYEAYSYGAAGISFKYAPESEPLTKSVVDGIHDAGFRIAVWTVNTPEDIAAVWATGADVVQTDNPDFYSYVP